jgi:hypothetical protein
VQVEIASGLCHGNWLPGYELMLAKRSSLPHRSIMIYSSRGYLSKFGPVELSCDEDYKVMASTVLESDFADEDPSSVRLNASSTWHDVQNDFTLRYEGHVVGRIRLAADAASFASLWEWQITLPMMIPDWARGSAGSHDMCFDAFAAAFSRSLVETSPERLGEETYQPRGHQPSRSSN